MYTSFYIAENRLNELKSFIRAELPNYQINTTLKTLKWQKK